jgi:hypothetical protein
MKSLRNHLARSLRRTGADALSTMEMVANDIGEITGSTTQLLIPLPQKREKHDDTSRGAFVHQLLPPSVVNDLAALLAPIHTGAHNWRRAARYVSSRIVHPCRRGAAGPKLTRNPGGLP